MRIHRSLKLTAAAALSSVVATLALAGPLAGSALAAPKAKAPLPTVTAQLSASDSTALASPTASPTAHFAWSQITGQSYTCFLDGGSKSTCTTSADYSGIGSGTHTFTIKIAKYSTFRPNTYVFTWTVDRTPPSSPPAVDPLPTPTSSRTANVTFGPVDPSTASYKCALDDSNPAHATTCASPWPLSGLSETTHTAYVYAVDGLLNMNTTPGKVTWTVDLSAPDSPTVSVTPVGPTSSTDATITWVDGDAVSFSCVLDSNPPVNGCTSGMVLHNLSEGTHVVAVTGTDAAGNVGTAGKVHWIVDQTPPPPPMISTGPATTTDATMATLQFADADAGATFECKLDSTTSPGSYAPCTSPKTYLGPLADDNYQFSVRAIDAAANQGQPSTWSWTVNTTSPAAASPPQILTGPAPLTHDVAPAFTWLSLDDPAATFVCAVDPADPTNQAAYTACGASGDSFPVAAEGSHTLYLEEVSSGATSLPATWTWTLDSTPPPAPTFNAKPDAFINTTSAMFNFSDTEANVSYVCQLDAQTAFPCATPANVTQLSEANHTFTVKATDAAGNTGPDSVATYSWTVDLTAPASPTVSGADPSGTTATLGFGDADLDVTGYLCTLDGASPAPCVSPATFSGLPSGSNTILVQAVDHAGNISAPQPYTWMVDAGAPNQPSIDSGPGSLVNTQVADFAFSDAATAGDSRTDVSGFECWLDVTKLPCSTTDLTDPASGTMHLTGVPEGEHTFTVVAVNSLGNGTAAVYPFTVDLTAPATPDVTGTSGAVNTATASFTYTDTSGDVASYTCSLDGATYAACPPSSPTSTFSGLADGVHNLGVKAVDQAGNVSTSAAHVTWTVDTVAPTAALTVPSTLTGSAGVAFGEAVSGLDVTKVALKATDSGTVVPSAVSCLKAGVATSCSASIDALRVTPNRVLVPGQHYTVSLTAGAVHDAASNGSSPATRSFRAQRVLQESTLPVADAWQTVKTRSAAGHSLADEHQAGSQVSWTFRGSAVTWLTATGRSQGKALVLVDGKKKATVNNYATSTHYKVARTFKRLGNRTHTITIRVLGVKGAKAGTGTFVIVDAFKVGTKLTASPRLVAGLHRVAGSQFFGRHAVTADLAGEAVSLTFRGRSVSWTTLRNRYQGKAAVYVDGVRKAVVDNYATGSLFKVTRTVKNLTDTVHTLRIVVLGQHHKGAKGNSVTIDRFAIG